MSDWNAHPGGRPPDPRERARSLRVARIRRRHLQLASIGRAMPGRATDDTTPDDTEGVDQ